MEKPIYAEMSQYLHSLSQTSSRFPSRSELKRLLVAATVIVVPIIARAVKRPFIQPSFNMGFSKMR